MKMWCDEKEQKVLHSIEEFTAWEDPNIDIKLLQYDCKASEAHAKLLHKHGVLSNKELKAVIRELREISYLAKLGKFKMSPKDEDCHTAIENHLSKRLGNTGKKLHLFRSRNDQIAGTLRLYYREQIRETLKCMKHLSSTLKNLDRRYGAVGIPGYTHTRKGMPSSIHVWCECFLEALEEDRETLKHAAKMVDRCPLGTGAGYGLPIKIDRAYLAKQLAFKHMIKSPLYVQNSREKIEGYLLHALNQIMGDLNKMASDIILFSSEKFAYFEIPAELCTGSSIMPHKQNPDALELIRGAYGITLGHEIQVKLTCKNLISGYHRDLQLTKKPTIETFEIVQKCMKMMAKILIRLKVNKTACEKDITPEMFSTARAYKLALCKNIPFRDAYFIVRKDLQHL
jgi:argininosuccinate lyase